MTQPTDDLEVRSDDEAERIYKWTIRALYAFAIALNVYMLVDQMKDSEEWAITRRRWEYRLAAWKRRAEPVLARLDFHHHAAALIGEAEQVVEAARPRGADGA